MKMIESSLTSTSASTMSNDFFTINNEDNGSIGDDFDAANTMTAESTSSPWLKINNNNNCNSQQTNENPGMIKLNQLSENWLELESDPGLFTLLIHDFGCTSVEVEEIYDLQSSFDEQFTNVYGFIFLFNVIEERRNRCNQRMTPSSSLTSSASSSITLPQSSAAASITSSTNFAPTSSSTSSTSDMLSSSSITMNSLNYQSPSCLLSGHYIDDEKFRKEIFFAHQKVPNSCATHAILSVLLNCSNNLDIGPMLKRLKEYTKNMTAEDRGLAISNIPELAKAHNSHATNMYYKNELRDSSSLSSSMIPSTATSANSGITMNSAIRISQRTTAQNLSMDAFHFVSFVPINGHLIELDGLKDRPIDHGKIDQQKESWKEKFRRLVRQRIETSSLMSSSATASTSNGGIDIRYNLMAVIPNKYEYKKRSLKQMQLNRLSLMNTLEMLELYEKIQISNEHNYSKVNHLLDEENNEEVIIEAFDTTVDELYSRTTKFLPQNLSNGHIELTNDSFKFSDSNYQDDDYIDDGTTTDTASEASSSYNYSICHDNTSEYDECKKFFVCKFDIDNGQNNQMLNDADDSISTISSTNDDEDEDDDDDLIDEILLEIINEMMDKIEYNDKLLLLNKRKFNDKNDYKHFRKKKRRKKELKIEKQLINSIIDKIDNSELSIQKSLSKILDKTFSSKEKILSFMNNLIKQLSDNIINHKNKCQDEMIKLERYKIDFNRRIYDYDALIQTFMSMLIDQNLLLCNYGSNHPKEECSTVNESKSQIIENNHDLDEDENISLIDQEDVDEESDEFQASQADKSLNGSIDNDVDEDIDAIEDNENEIDDANETENGIDNDSNDGNDFDNDNGDDDIEDSIENINNDGEIGCQDDDNCIDDATNDNNENINETTLYNYQLINLIFPNNFHFVSMKNGDDDYYQQQNGHHHYHHHDSRNVHGQLQHKM